MQTNCIPGQKWRCERDGHRWRRHKCKYAAPPPRMSKKCACFTPNGVVYTRLESNDYDYVHRYPGFGRDRRPTDVYADVARYFARRGKSRGLIFPDVFIWKIFRLTISRILLLLSILIREKCLSISLIYPRSNFSWHIITIPICTLLFHYSTFEKFDKCSLHFSNRNKTID